MSQKPRIDFSSSVFVTAGGQTDPKSLDIFPTLCHSYPLHTHIRRHQIHQNAYFIMSTGVGMSSCCLTGKVQEGTPKGHVETIAGLQTYVAEPKNADKSKTIIFLVDSKSPSPSLMLSDTNINQSLAGSSRTLVCSPTSMPPTASLPTFPMFTRATRSTLNFFRPSSLKRPSVILAPLQRRLPPRQRLAQLLVPGY